MKLLTRKEVSDLVWIGATIFLLIAFAFLCAGCSHTSQVISAESKQTAAALDLKKASVKVHRATAAEMGEIANLAVKEKMVLSMPITDQTKVAIDDLANAQLSLAGAPTDREQVLQQEVDSLLAGGEKQEQENARLQKEGAQLKADKEKALEDKAKFEAAYTQRTEQLYQVATIGAQSADYSLSIFKWVGAAAALLALWVIVRLGLAVADKFGTAAATAAAKAP